LYGIDQEARFKTVKGTNRVKVSRRYRRITAGQERMTAVRAGGVSMISQEPTSAMNPIFSISDQISEALLLHRGPAIVGGLLNAKPTGPGVERAIQDLVRAARLNSPPALREACERLGQAANLPSLSTQSYYLFRSAWAEPEAKVPELRNALKRLH